MSYLAEAWVNAQKVGSSSRRHTLRVIAHYFNDEEGFAWPSTKALAAKTEQSIATVERNLTALEADGFIRREIVRYGADGGAKRRIYLNLDTPRVEAQLRIKRTPRPRKVAAGAPNLDGGTSPHFEGTLPEASESLPTAFRSPHIDGRVPSTCGSGPLNLRQSDSLGKNINQDSPQPPDVGGRDGFPKLIRGNGLAAPPVHAIQRRRDAAPDLEPAIAAAFDRLWAAYPEGARPYSDRADAQRTFAELSETDRDLAIAAARGERVRLATSTMKPKALHTWLRKRRFVNLRPVAPAPVGAAAPEARVFVRDGTPAWEAWKRFERSEGRVPRAATWSQTERADGWWYPSPMPPAAAEAA